MKVRIAGIAVAVAAAGGVVTALPAPAMAATGELVWNIAGGEDILMQRAVRNPVRGRCYTTAHRMPDNHSRTGVVSNNTNSPAAAYSDLNCQNPHPFQAYLAPGKSGMAVGSVRFVR